MAKFRSPFYSGEVFISQTYHSGSNNTAVDFGSRAVGTAVYAIANGVIQTVSPLYGSYLTLKVDNSDHTLFYVHIYNFTVKAGSRVSVGQKIAEIAPQSVNGNVPPHLHLGLQTGKYLMDYMDRSIVFRTKYQAIKDIWFIGENLNWSKFQDLSYLNTPMSNFKIGDRIEFTGSQNMRGGDGTSFPVVATTSVGMTGTIIDGSRSADGYTWWDIRIDGGTSGWCADVGKFRIYTEPVKPPEPPVNPCKESEQEVVRLNAVISGLKGEMKEMSDKYEKSLRDKTQLTTENEELTSSLQDCRLKLEKSQENFIEKIKNWVSEVLKEIIGNS